MNAKYKMTVAMLTGVVLGAAAVQGLHAQAKPKAYTVTELETIDAKAAADLAKRIQAAQTNAGGRNFRTGGGKVVGMEGPPPPKRVAITEWASLEKAEAFFKSKAWTDLGPDRDKALKTIRRYAAIARGKTQDLTDASGPRILSGIYHMPERFFFPVAAAGIGGP